MSLTSPKLLKLDKKSKKVVYQDSILPQARNRIYQKSVNVGCPYCTDKSGRKKNFKNLHRLYYHFRYQHSDETRHKELIMNLADLILKGVLL